MDITLMDEKIRRYCTENKIMATIRITVKDEIRYQSRIGYANVEKNLGFSENSKFSFYSLSKPFCAIGLLKLKDKGLVDLDAHPAKYVAEAAFDKRVTIRHLLLHISGLPDFLFCKEFAEKYAPGTVQETRRHLKALAEIPSYFDPGTRGMYANINFTLCALIIENVTGLSYAEYMKKEVFQPLGMQTAEVDNENLVVSDRVQGYALENDVLVAVNTAHDWMLGAGDIVGTADDVYCLNKAIKNRLLLSNETWEEVLTPSPISGFGMGCRVNDWNGKQRIIHNGGLVGFRTLHEQIPQDDFDLIILSNTGFGNARDDIMEIVHETFYGRDGLKVQAIEMDKGYI